MKVRRFLYSKGLRYRVHYGTQGKPDVVFPNDKLAILVHGCFWHVHGCENSVMPKSNKSFWRNKLKKNKERDKNNLQKLRDEGWRTKIVWECELRRNETVVLQNIFSWIRKNRY